MTTDTLTFPPLAVHPRDRMIWQPDVFLAALVPGQSGADNGYGIGDCLLIDAPRGVYAVADASERCPEASRELLERFHAALCGSDGPPPTRALDAAVSAAFAGQAYTARCTFCCVALRWEAGRPAARIFSGGDSFAAIFTAAGRRVLHQSAPDMGFAGRSKTVPAGTDVLPDGGRWHILLATDGWRDRHPSAATGAARRSQLADAVATGNAPRLDPVPGGDDLAFIVAAPGTAPPPPGAVPAVMMGGTTAAESAASRRRRSHCPPPADWLPAAAGPDCRRALAAAGIRVMTPAPVPTVMENRS